MRTFNQDMNKVLGEWVNFLPSTSIELALKLNKKAKGLRDTVTVYPEQEDIFKVFHMIKPNEVKVVILGQDPYHNGNATGAAFACGKTISPSLKQIWDSIKKDTDKEYEGEVNPTLNHLLLQGVLLLNTILTVQEGKPLSHKYMKWENFTASVVHNLSKHSENIVFMLWGSYAQKYNKYIDDSKHLVLMDTHPVYATYNKVDWNCTHFSYCNNYFKQLGISPIKWR